MPTTLGPRLVLLTSALALGACQQLSNLTGSGTVAGREAGAAVAGESAGGNLAINVAIAARDAGLPAPRHMAPIYPVAGTDTPFYRENTATAPLFRAGML